MELPTSSRAVPPKADNRGPVLAHLSPDHLEGAPDAAGLADGEAAGHLPVYARLELRGHGLARVAQVAQDLGAVYGRDLIALKAAVHSLTYPQPRSAAWAACAMDGLFML